MGADREERAGDLAPLAGRARAGEVEPVVVDRRQARDEHGTTGELFVVADTIPPRIRPLFTDGADLTRAPAMRFRVGDNFSGIASCTLLIDGKWVPCDRLPMQGTLIHLFEEPPARKSHSVRLTLTDACGNTACWEGTIRR